MARTARRSRTLSALAAFVGAAVLVIGGLSSSARAEDALVHYNANSRDYWEHPPADWYMGDETAAQHGERPYPGQPIPTSHDELVKLVAENIKLQPGFHIEVLASGVDCARQMVFGSDGTLYAGCWNDHVFALKKENGQWVSKVIIKGLRMPTGVGFYNGALYVADIDKIYKCPDIANTLDNPKGEIVYSDFPPYTSHAGNTWWPILKCRAGFIFQSGRPATFAWCLRERQSTVMSILTRACRRWRRWANGIASVGTWTPVAASCGSLKMLAIGWATTFLPINLIT